MIPQLDNLIEFEIDEANNQIIVPSKTYKLNIESGLLYIDEYLENITFKIVNSNLIEKIKNENIPIRFKLENGYLIVFDEEEVG